MFPSGAALPLPLRDARRLGALCEAAGFTDVEVGTEARRYPFPSFDAYFDLVERGGSPTGLEYAALPKEVRHAVRDDGAGLRGCTHRRSD